MIDQFRRIIGFNPRLRAHSSQNQTWGGSPLFQNIAASHLHHRHSTTTIIFAPTVHYAPIYANNSDMKVPILSIEWTHNRIFQLGSFFFLLAFRTLFYSKLA